MLDELRKKPKAVRERYALLGTSILTLSIAGIWFVSLGVNIPEQSEQVAEKQTSENNLANVWQAFSAKIGNAVSKLGELSATSSEETNVDTTATSSQPQSAVDKVISDSFRGLEEKQQTPKTVQIATSSKATSTLE